MKKLLCSVLLFSSTLYCSEGQLKKEVDNLHIVTCWADLERYTGRIVMYTITPRDSLLAKGYCVDRNKNSLLRYGYISEEPREWNLGNPRHQTRQMGYQVHRLLSTQGKEEFCAFTDSLLKHVCEIRTITDQERIEIHQLLCTQTVKFEHPE